MPPLSPKIPNNPEYPIGLQPEPHAMALTLADVQTIGHALRKNFRDKDDLITSICDSVSISVEDVTISLEPRLLQRLQSRSLDKSSWDKWLSDLVVRGLHDFSGY